MEMDTSPDRTVHLPPQTVRIKRKRGQDPLQALLVDETNGGLKKRARPNSYVFRLAGTFEEEPVALGDENPLLYDANDETGNQSERKVFRFKKQKNVAVPHDDPQVSQSLTDMVHNYLELEQPAATSPTTTKSGGGEGQSTPPDQEVDLDAEVEDYVYDIYYREKYNNDDLGDSSKIGLIFFDSDEDGLVGVHDSDDLQDTGDEDSNAEDFYKNDYPDEESEDSIWSDDGTGQNDGFRHVEIDFDAYGQFDDDEDDFNDDTFENWSEDEDYEQYRERIWGKLEQALENNHEAKE